MLTFKQFNESKLSFGPEPKKRVQTVVHHKQLHAIIDNDKYGEAKVLVAHHGDGTHTIHAWPADHGLDQNHTDIANSKYKKYPPKFSAGTVHKQDGKLVATRSNYSLTDMKDKNSSLGSQKDLDSVIDGMKKINEMAWANKQKVRKGRKKELGYINTNRTYTKIGGDVEHNGKTMHISHNFVSRPGPNNTRLTSGEIHMHDPDTGKIHATLHGHIENDHLTGITGHAYGGSYEPTLKHLTKHFVKGIITKSSSGAVDIDGNMKDEDNVKGASAVWHRLANSSDHQVHADGKPVTKLKDMYHPDINHPVAKLPLTLTRKK